MHFVLISKELSHDKVGLAFRVRNFCDIERPGPGWCGVLIWVRESRVAKKLPMSDRQQQAEFATYTRNPYTGYECLQFLKGDHEISHMGNNCS